jgi:hypothetical protein
MFRKFVSEYGVVLRMQSYLCGNFVPVVYSGMALCGLCGD